MLKTFKFLFVTFALLACQGPNEAGLDYKVITSRAELVSLVEGRSLVSADGQETYMLHPDGSISGTYRGANVSGGWEWVDGAYCREVRAGELVLPYECVAPAVSGDTVRVARRGGRTGWRYYRLTAS